LGEVHETTGLTEMSTGLGFAPASEVINAIGLSPMNEILATLGTPIMLRSELLAAGHSDRDIARLLRARVLHRVRHGAYVDGSAWATADAAGRHTLRACAVARQASTRVVLSHASVLPFFGAPTWGFSLDDVHITRPDARSGRREAGVRQHRGLLLDSDIEVRHGYEVTSGTKTALDVTCCAGAEASLVAVGFLLHNGFTTVPELRARYAGMTQHPFTLKTDLVLRLADDRMESIGEIRSFFMLYRAGVPAPVPQYELRDALGDLIARLDFAWPEFGVWLEFDGREKYLKHLREGESVIDAVLREKQRESRICELTGWRCIRITWEDLQRPEATVARILTMLGVAPRVPRFT
jgi:hypothetical protein